MPAFRHIAVLAGLLAVLLLPAGLEAQERIVSFESFIEVKTDGSLEVTENITVVAEGRQIRRGIFRDFPTRYNLPDGSTMRIGFEVLRVTQDGDRASWVTETVANGIRVRIGDANRLLSRGRHSYAITYRTTRQLRFGDGVDELYWNVTGNGWDFAIDSAAAVVMLPEGADFNRSTAFTGVEGSTAGEYEEFRRQPGAIGLRATRRLDPREGLTIAVEWPAGFVQRPTPVDQARGWLADNLPLIIGLFGLLVVGGYFAWTWHRVGRDPDGGPVFAQYEPPKAVSPAASQFISRMAVRDEAFTAAIVSMAVKGYLTIDDGFDDDYILKRTEKSERECGLAPGERAVGRSLFPRGIDRVDLSDTYQKTVSDARDMLDAALEREYRAAHFDRNRSEFYIGLVLAAATIVAVISSAGNGIISAIFIGASLVIGFVTYAIYSLLTSKLKKLRFGVGGIKIAIFAFFLLFSGPFAAFQIALVSLTANSMMLSTIIIIAVVIFMTAVFSRLLMAPTLKGRQVMNDIEGFKLYLSVAEKDRMNFHNPPEDTPELFEAYLPYAIALGVENEWGERFDGILAAAARDKGDGGYHPHWYIGRRGRSFSPSTFAQSMGAGLTSTIAAASVPPSSSSGSSGFSGGFSGGGGGGGGGGGW